MSRLIALTSGLLGMRAGGGPLEAARFASIETMRILAPFFISAAAFSLAAAAAQGGFITKPLSLELDKLNPLSGLRRIFSLAGLGETLKSLMKFIIGGTIFYFIIMKALLVLPFTTAMGVNELINVSGRSIAQAVMYAFSAFAVIAVIDYVLERWKFERSIRMTREEIREEYKETEGDPQIKSRIKSIQREMAVVDSATVVATHITELIKRHAWEILLILTYQKPVSYITTGQRVLGDIETATVGRLAGLIMQKRECAGREAAI